MWLYLTRKKCSRRHQGASGRPRKPPGRFQDPLRPLLRRPKTRSRRPSWPPCACVSRFGALYFFRKIQESDPPEKRRSDSRFLAEKNGSDSRFLAEKRKPQGWSWDEFGDDFKIISGWSWDDFLLIPGWFQDDFKMIFKWFCDVLGRF